VTKEILVAFLSAPDVVQDLNTIFLNEAEFVLVPKALHFEQFGHNNEYNSEVNLRQKQIDFDPEILPDIGPSKEISPVSLKFLSE